MRIAPFNATQNEEVSALMVRCIRDMKKRDVQPGQDDDVFDLENYYHPQEDSLLLVILSSVEREREKVVGTLGLKCKGIIDGKKTGMLRRLYVEPEHRWAALLPLFRAMREHVIDHQFEKLQFIARRRMGSVFETYKCISEHLGMKEDSLDEESILFTWDLPESNAQLVRKLFTRHAK